MSPKPIHIRKGGTTLKELVRWQLWLVIAANLLFFYGVIQTSTIRLEGIHAVLTQPKNLLAAGIGLLVTTVLDGLLSDQAKARIVFLRWRHPLPGHRAFTTYALSDPRLDIKVLENHIGNLPSDAVEQNLTWYRIYKTVDERPVVRQAQRDFLLLRDYTGLAVVFIVGLAPIAFYAVASWKVACIYTGVLCSQLLLVRHAASNYGIRFVRDVLVQFSAVPPKESSFRKREKKPKTDTRSKMDQPIEPGST